jgi:hypothetical protein
VYISVARGLARVCAVGESIPMAVADIVALPLLDELLVCVDVLTAALVD